MCGRGVWLYVKRVNFPNAKYLVVFDRPGWGTTEVSAFFDVAS